MTDLFSDIKKGSIITFLITLLIIAGVYHQVFFDLNHHLFSAWGDGVKNYYTYIYHAQYDQSFWEFGGMNYPYYEHMVYTDGHPLLSWIIGTLGLGNYAIGILNFLILMSYPFGAFFLYLILRHYQVKGWWAMIAAVCLILLSPQVFRTTGHFSLAYACAIPCMWYLLIQTKNHKKWYWSLGGFLLVLIFFFTHPYLGLILGLFALTFWMVNTIITKQLKIGISQLFIQGLLPIILFQALVFMTDTHLNRTGEPQGFFDFYASWKSLLLPHHGPLVGLQNAVGLKNSHWEVLAYVGFGTLIMFVAGIFVLIKKHRNQLNRKLVSNELVIFIIVAWIILVFSFCFPFKYDWMKWLTDNFGPLKQFRVLGRFAWIFYYVITIATVILWYRLYQKSEKKKVLTGVFIFAMLFNGIEGLMPHIEVAHVVQIAPNAFDKNDLDPDLQEMIGFVNESDYDALMVLPFQHMSSENIMLLASEEANFDAFMLSYHTRKPLLNSTSSRMSIDEAIAFNNLFSPEYIEKDLIYDLPKEDDIIIIKRKEWVRDGEMRLVFSSALIFENETYFAFHFDREFYNRDYYFKELLEREKECSFELKDGWKSDTSATWFLYESFDENEGESFAGGGSYRDHKEWEHVIYEITEPLDNGWYEVSYWYYLGVDAPNMLAVVDQDFGGVQKSAWSDQFDIKQSTLIVNQWCQVKLKFEWTDITEKIKVVLLGNNSKQPFYVDELLIRKIDDGPLMKRVMIDRQEYLVYNNDYMRANQFEK